MTVSLFGALLALAYVALAVFIVVQDRRPGRGGDWISLRGMASAIVTAPLSFTMEMLGHKLSYRRNLDMAFAIMSCAVLVYLVGAGIGWLGSAILRWNFA